MRPVALAVPILVAAAGAVGCAPRAALCTRACDATFVCASGECVGPGAIPAIEARARFGGYQARRLVIAPVEVARLAPGDARAQTSTEAVLGRDRDARAVLLLRFAVDLPPGTSVLEAHILLDRASAETDPSPVVLHAARVSDAWDARSVAWGSLPRIEDSRGPATTIDAPLRQVRLDVRPLVRDWRAHRDGDQGLAVVADACNPSGIRFALADEAASGDHAGPSLPQHASGPGPVFAAADGVGASSEPGGVSGPRLELYVKP